MTGVVHPVTNDWVFIIDLAKQGLWEVQS